MKLCSIENCGRQHAAKGYCADHYSRWKRHGDPEVELRGGRDRARSGRVFWTRVDEQGEDDCWPWIGSKDQDGYGRASWYNINGKRIRAAHRIAYQLFYGTDPGEFCVCHKCDNPICCNPHHLFLGTQGDNQKDRKAKYRTVIGDKNGNRELAADDIPIIRQLRGEGLTYPQIAKMFGVCDATISHICNGRTWNHVPIEPLAHWYQGDVANADAIDFLQEVGELG